MTEATLTLRKAMDAVSCPETPPTPEQILALAQALESYRASPTPAWAMDLAAEGTLGRSLIRLLHHRRPLPLPELLHPLVDASAPTDPSTSPTGEPTTPPTG